MVAHFQNPVLAFQLLGWDTIRRVVTEFPGGIRFKMIRATCSCQLGYEARLNSVPSHSSLLASWLLWCPRLNSLLQTDHIHIIISLEIWVGAGRVCERKELMDKARVSWSPSFGQMPAYIHLILLVKFVVFVKFRKISITFASFVLAGSCHQNWC